MKMKTASLLTAIFLITIWGFVIYPYSAINAESSETPDSLPVFTRVAGHQSLDSVTGMGQTATWVDVDSDGWLDLFVSNVNIRERSLFVFRNLSGGGFKDITKATGVLEQPYRSLAWADFNQDGLVDLLAGTIKGSDTPHVYVNRGGVFEDMTKELGVGSLGTVFHSFWVDYNNDGWPDIFQVNTSGVVLYRNTGFGTFENVTENSGIQPFGNSRSAIWLDYNNDSYPDLFLANMSFNVLYKNNGDGTFSDVTDKAGVAGGKRWRSVAACSGDFNNDGFYDLYVVNISGKMAKGGPTGNALYKNNGDGSFSEITKETNTSDKGDGRTCRWVDFDQDGWLDLYSTNHTNVSVLYHNEAGKGFTDVAKEVGLEFPYDVFAATWGDYNHDGLIDAYLNGHITSGLFMAINNPSNFNYVLIRPLRSSLLPGSLVVGARVDLSTSAGVQTRVAGSVGGAYIQDSQGVYFGVGNADKARVEVIWPNGDKCLIDDLVISGPVDLNVSQDGCKIHFNN